MKKIVLKESELVSLIKKIVNEQSVKLADEGAVIIAGYKYKLQKSGIDVNVDDIKPQADGSLRITASLGFISKQDTLPKVQVYDIIKLAEKGADKIPVPNKKGEIDKQLVKIKK